MWGLSVILFGKLRLLCTVIQTWQNKTYNKIQIILLFLNYIYKKTAEKYKIDSDGLYFKTFSGLSWIDVFTRR